MTTLALPLNRTAILTPRRRGVVPPPAGPSFAFIAASPVSEAANSGSRTLSKPTGVVENDVLVAAVYRNAAVTATPSGWNLAEAGSLGQLRVWWKLCEAAEPASWVWTFAASGSIKGVVLGFSGAAGVTLDGTSQDVGGPSGWDLPSITLTTTNELLVAVCISGGDRTYTEPVGMTELLDTGAGAANLSMAAYSEIVPSAGASGIRSITSGSVTNNAIMLALRGA
jgi:hypothetical protein